MTTPDPDEDLLATLESELAAGILDLSDFDHEALDLPDLSALTADDITTRPAAETQRYRQPPRAKILHPRLITFERAAEAAAQVWPMTTGERVHMLVNGTFRFGDFLEASAKARDWLMQELWVSTLSLNVDNVESLANLMAGNYLRELHMVVSDYWFAHTRGPQGLLPYLYDTVEAEATTATAADGQPRSFQLSVAGSHVKLALIRLDDGRCYTISGSANLRSAAVLELMTVEDDPAIFDFHRQWMAALEAQYWTINHEAPNLSRCKSAPRRSEWDTIERVTASRNPETPTPER